MRCYSSDSRDASRGIGNGTTETSQPQSTGFGSSFGFQSLSGLFQQSPPSGRYSRPREPEQPPIGSEQDASGTPANKTPVRVEEGFFQPSREAESSAAPTEPVPDDVQGSYARRLPPATFLDTTYRTLDRTADTTQDQEADAANPPPKSAGRNRRLIRAWPTHDNTPERKRSAGHDREHARRAQNAQRRPDPFASEAVPAIRRVSLDPSHEVQPPWGLSQEDMDTVESITDPSSAALPAVARNPETEVTASTIEASAKDQSARLTHVTATGEAHMVDVGAKQATRRVAVAFAYIRFNNPEPFRLIFENSNRKGDVLGVARVAGIMAAKRTSDLIPLCHPLAISKVEVDVMLEAPGSSSQAWKDNKFGIVTVQAQVECVGPTGVEMEALTCATGAALTVYDMCKAVDRQMVISGTRVVYKSGGKSGMHYEAGWANRLGKVWFEEKRLQVPATPVLVGARPGNGKGRKDQGL